jgi:type I restriction enzyme M protein
VKTSILILDKSLAKQADTVGFFKVENDGFNLGAQRRPIDKNDMPQVLGEINEYLRRLRAKESVAAEDFSPSRGLIIAKEKIAANGDFNLSGERYREAGATSHSFPHVRLDDVCTINPPKSEALSLPPNTLVSFVPMADLGENRIAFRPKETRRIDELGTSYTYFADGDVLVAKVTPCFENGKAGIARDLSNGIGFGSSEFYVLRPSDRVLPEFIYFCITHAQFRKPAIEQMTGTGGLQRVPKGFVENFEIPLPTLEVQKEIVAEIEAYQRVIDGARAVLDHYRPHIPINPEWPMVELGEITEDIQYGLSIPMNTTDAGFKTFRMNELVEGKCVDRGDMKHADIPREEFEKYRLKRGDILFNRTNSFEHVGRTGIFDLDGEYCFASYLIRLAIAAGKADPFYVNAFMNSASFQEGIKQFATRAIGQSNINAKSLAAYRIPVPPLAEQEKIVAEIEAEQRLVEGNRQLIERMEQKIAGALARIWGD